MKQQMNVRVPQITRHQIDKLCARQDMTNGEVVTMAIDRLYAQLPEFRRVRYGFHAADLFEGWDEPEKYDERKSAQAYAEMLRAELEEEYPCTEIVIDYDFGASGILQDSLQCAIDEIGIWETDHDEIASVEHIAGLVFQTYKWAVEI